MQCGDERKRRWRVWGKDDASAQPMSSSSSSSSSSRKRKRDEANQARDCQQSRTLRNMFIVPGPRQSRGNRMDTVLAADDDDYDGQRDASGPSLSEVWKDFVFPAPTTSAPLVRRESSSLTDDDDVVEETSSSSRKKPKTYAALCLINVSHSLQEQRSCQ